MQCSFSRHIVSITMPAATSIVTGDKVSGHMMSITTPTAAGDKDTVVLHTTDDTFTDDEDSDLNHELDSIADTLDVEAGQILVNDKEDNPQSQIYIPTKDATEVERMIVVINKTQRCFDDDVALVTVDGHLKTKAQLTFNSLQADVQKKVKEMYHDQDVITLEYSDKIGKHTVYDIYCYSQKALVRFGTMVRNMWSAEIQKMRKTAKTPLCIFTDVPYLNPESSCHFFGVSGYRIKRLTENFRVAKGLFVENIPESLFATQQVLISKWAVDKLGTHLDVFRKAVIDAVEEAKAAQAEAAKPYESY